MWKKWGEVFFNVTSRRTQDFFRPGGKIIYNIRGEKQAGGGCGRLVSPLLDDRAFAFSKLQLNDLVHTLSGIFSAKKSLPSIYCL